MSIPQTEGPYRGTRNTVAFSTVRELSDGTKHVCVFDMYGLVCVLIKDPTLFTWRADEVRNNMDKHPRWKESVWTIFEQAKNDITEYIETMAIGHDYADILIQSFSLGDVNANMGDKWIPVTEIEWPDFAAYVLESYSSLADCHELLNGEFVTDLVAEFRDQYNEAEDR